MQASNNVSSNPTPAAAAPVAPVAADPKSEKVKNLVKSGFGAGIPLMPQALPKGLLNKKRVDTQVEISTASGKVNKDVVIELMKRFGEYVEKRAKEENINPATLTQETRKDWFSDFQKLQAAEFAKYSKMNEATKADEEFAKLLAGESDLIDLERQITKDTIELKAGEAAIAALEQQMKEIEKEQDLLAQEFRTQFSVALAAAAPKNVLPVTVVPAAAQPAAATEAGEAAIAALEQQMKEIEKEQDLLAQQLRTQFDFALAAAAPKNVLPVTVVPAAAQPAAATEAVEVDEDADFLQVNPTQSTQNGKGWMASIISWYTWDNGKEKIAEAAKKIEDSVKKP